MTCGTLKASELIMWHPAGLHRGFSAKGEGGGDFYVL